jgi:hypothetical protein
MPELNKKLFKKLVKKVREKHPKLKIRIFWKRKILNGGATGEYGWGTLNVAAGSGEIDGWGWVISTFAHEYSHYLRELKHSARYSNVTYRATAVFYNQQAPKEKRKRAMYWVLRDEYYTDVGAWEILQEWGIAEHFPDWWRWASCYNYKIKYWFNTGIWLSGGDSFMKALNRKLSLKEILRPLSPAKKRYFTSLVGDPRINAIGANKGGNNTI